MRPVVTVSLVLVLSAYLAIAQDDKIDMKSVMYCTLEPNSKMTVNIHFYDTANLAVRFHVLDENNNTMSNCKYNGTGNQTHPWIIETQVDRFRDDETNDCGMQVIPATNGGKDYTWVIRSFQTQDGAIFAGQAFRLTSTCNSNTGTTGQVETSVGYRYVPFYAAAQNPKAITAPNTFAKGATLNLIATLYPEGFYTQTELKGASGYFAKDCIASSDVNFQNNVRVITNSRGCKLDGTSGFTRTSTEGVTPITLGTTTTAENTGDQKEQYIRCAIAKCTTTNNPCCDDPCAADPNNQDICQSGPNGVLDTGRSFTTNFNVQDVPAQRLYAARLTAPSDPLTNVAIQTDITLVAQMHPFGINASETLKTAEGFYVYSCTHSKNQGTGQKETFIDINGCPQTNTLFDFLSGYKLDETLSDIDNNLNVLITGRATVKATTSTGRVFIECQTGICTDKNHNYVKLGRCNSVDNIPDKCNNLGPQGLTTDFAIIDPDSPAYQLTQQDDEGNQVRDGFTVPVGQGVGFGAAVVPGGSGQVGDVLKNVAGIYVRSCTSTLTLPDGIKEVYETIDKEGCRITGTPEAPNPISFSEPCTDVSEFPSKPPHKISCGKVSSSKPGEVETECQLGGCLEEDSLYCKDRCAAGAIQADSRVLDTPGAPPITSKFVAKERAFSDTAKRSNELRNIVIGAGVALPIAFVATFGTLALLCLKLQKSGKF